MSDGTEIEVLGAAELLRELPPVDAAAVHHTATVAVFELLEESRRTTGIRSERTSRLERMREELRDLGPTGL